MRVHSICAHPRANTVVCLSGIQEIYRAHQPDKSHCEQEECGCRLEDGKLLVLTLLVARPGVVPTGRVECVTSLSNNWGTHFSACMAHTCVSVKGGKMDALK